MDVGLWGNRQQAVGRARQLQCLPRYAVRYQGVTARIAQLKGFQRPFEELSLALKQ